MTAGTRYDGPLDAVLFDMDGLLVDSEPVWTTAETELAALLGGEWTWEIKSKIIGTSLPHATRQILDHYGSDADLDWATGWLLRRMIELFHAGVPLLPGALAGLFDLRRQQWARVEYLADPQQNEKVAAREMVAGLPVGSLILADLGYFGFAWFDALTDAAYWWVSRLRAKTSYTLIHAYYQRGETLDAVVWLGAHRADRAKHAVRLVQFRQGGTLYRYVTNVLDPATLPMAEIARLYARRWDIELAFKLVKTHLGLHLLWGAKPVVVLQQVWAVLIIAQVLQALRLEIAGRAGVDPYEVSLPLLVEYLPFLAARGLDPVTVFVEQGRALRFIRPSSRTVIVAPEIPPADLVPRPPDLVVERLPRYAQRKCGPRAATAA